MSVEVWKYLFIPRRISVAGQCIRDIGRGANLPNLLGSQLDIDRRCVLLEVFDLLGSGVTISDLIW